MSTRSLRSERNDALSSQPSAVEYGIGLLPTGYGTVYSRVTSRPTTATALAVRYQLPATVSSYAPTGGHAHTRLRSPYGLSIRATAGQTLCARTNGSG